MKYLYIQDSKHTRLINVYRSHKPKDNLTPREKFKLQLELIRLAMTNETLLMGDFNIDFNKGYAVDYVHRFLFEDFNVALSNFGLEQLIDFVTWSRLVNNVYKSSLLDHVYSTNCTSISNIQSLKPIFGDHLLVHFDINIPK